MTREARKNHKAIEEKKKLAFLSFSTTSSSQPLSLKIERPLPTPHSHSLQVEVDKPLALQLAPSKAAGGGLVVKGVKGNAAAAGISVGDTIVYTSSFFGDELWPSDNLAFTRSALANAPSPVCIEFVKGENSSVNVKRLPKKPAPQRFGRKLTAAQKALATNICVDCGYIYALKTPFSETESDYRCPQVR